MAHSWLAAAGAITWLSQSPHVGLSRRFFPNGVGGRECGTIIATTGNHWSLRCNSYINYCIGGQVGMVTYEGMVV
jgi:hypothetical protein